MQLSLKAVDALWAKAGRVTDPVALRRLLDDAVPALVRRYGGMAGTVAAEWYQAVRSLDGVAGDGFEALPSDVSGEALDRAAESARWAAQPLFDAKSADQRGEALSRVREVVERHVRQAGQDTLARNAERDPRAARYAIVPTGARTCAWCVMLASRGGVYKSKASARGSVHAHCDCQALPDFGHGIKGYDPGRYYDLYEKAREQAGGDHATEDDILKALRENGEVTDATEPPTQTGAGGGGRKPPKHPKTVSGAEEPQEPNGDKNGHEPQLQNNEAINKCHEAVVRGNGVDLYDQAVSNGFSGSREDWASDLISKEIAERDSEWIESSGKIIPRAKFESKRAKRELKPHEKKTLQTLLDNGFGVTVQERSNVEGTRTADSLINGLKVDLKSPQGNYSSLDKLLQRAGKQGDAVVVDLQARTNRVTDETAIANIPKSLARRKLRYALLITHDGQLIRLYPDGR